jgi:hypothetical protein
VAEGGPTGKPTVLAGAVVTVALVFALAPGSTLAKAGGADRPMKGTALGDVAGSMRISFPGLAPPAAFPHVR